MFNSKNTIYLLTCLESIEKIYLYTNNINSPEELLEKDDQLIYNACLTLLLTLGEETNKIDSDLLAEFPQIPWQQIKGLRNRIVHDYRGLDPTIPFDVIKSHLGELRSALIAMIEKVDYPQEKLNKVLQSNYFKHIRYLEKK